MKYVYLLSSDKNVLYVASAKPGDDDNICYMNKDVLRINCNMIYWKKNERIHRTDRVGFYDTISDVAKAIIKDIFK